MSAFGRLSFGLWLLLAPIHAMAQDNSCEYASDNECDESRYGGTGACNAATDTSDCRILAAGATTDSCEYARDNECDEPRFKGTGACVDGSDTTDCQAAVAERETVFESLFAAVAPDLQRRLGDNSCQYAFDNECDDPVFGANDYCRTGTDAADCRALAVGGEDSCATANNTICEESRLGGDGSCADGTDLSDCDAKLQQDADAHAALLELLPTEVRRQLGEDSCQYASDRECDDLTFGGTGACDAGTDASDCRALASGGEDSCEYADDNECDEPGIGTGACVSGTDTRDCAGVAFMRNRDDSCDTAFDGICNEAELGDGTCAIFSDTADCIGRGRPAGLENHFFGRDDRILVEADQMPWSAIGLLDFDSASCTGTLVGPRLVLTAAHCLTEDGSKVTVPNSFSAGATRGGDLGTARAVAAIFSPNYHVAAVEPGNGTGEDWGLVFLDRDLGTRVGMLGVHLLSEQDLSAIRRNGLLVNQAGYSSDSGDNLSGNVGCRITRALDDFSVLHECDTAHGDSGSPFLLNIDGTWQIIAIDSQFFTPESKNWAFPQGNLAVDSRAFYDAVQQALAQQ